MSNFKVPEPAEMVTILKRYNAPQWCIDKIEAMATAKAEEFGWECHDAGFQDGFAARVEFTKDHPSA